MDRFGSFARAVNRFVASPAATNAKLDALIVAVEAADNRAVGLEYKTDSDAKAIAEEIIASVDAATEVVAAGVRPG